MCSQSMTAGWYVLTSAFPFESTALGWRSEDNRGVCWSCNGAEEDCVLLLLLLPPMLAAVFLSVMSHRECMWMDVDGCGWMSGWMRGWMREWVSHQVLWGFQVFAQGNSAISFQVLKIYHIFKQESTSERNRPTSHTHTHSHTHSHTHTHTHTLSLLE